MASDYVVKDYAASGRRYRPQSFPSSVDDGVEETVRGGDTEARTELGREPESAGRILRRERELRHLSLEELAQSTRIPLKMLQRLEEDRYDELPGEVFVRGFLKACGRAVGVSGDALVEVYDAGRTQQPEATTKAPLTAITPPERGRRFGIAVAVVILLILFTLALSIVLRPRHRDQPVELSSLTWPTETHRKLQVPTHQQWRGGAGSSEATRWSSES